MALVLTPNVIYLKKNRQISPKNQKTYLHNDSTNGLTTSGNIEKNSRASHIL